MPPIGNTNSFRASRVPPAKPSPAPVRTNRSPLAAAIAARPALTSPVFADRPHGSGTISAPKAAPPRPASAYAAAAAPRAPASRVTAAISRFAATHPFAPIATYGPRNAQALANLRVQNALGQIFQTLKAKNLLPQAAQEPSLSITQSDSPGAYEVGSGGKNGRIYYTPSTAIAATDPSAGAMYSWALQGLVHELAHTAQSAQTQRSIPLREGGAQAYADAVVPQVLGPLAENDSNYAGYVRQARRKGPAWYMRQQFGGS